MKLLINTPSELRRLSGTFSANINFERVETDVLLASEKVILLIGQPIYDKAVVILEKGDNATDEEKKLLQHIQLPIAVYAAYQYYQGNNLGHDENGRKSKVDRENEAQAWQWQIDRDDEAAFRKYRESLDRLVRHLDRSEDPDWIDTELRHSSRELFLNNTSIFSKYFYIDDSASFYYSLVPLINEVQQSKIKAVLGDDYTMILKNFQEDTTSSDMDGQLPLIQKALALYSMALAVKRFTLKVMPEGVVQQYKTYEQGLTSSNIAQQPAIEWYMLYLSRDADKALDDLRKFRSKSTFVAPLIPKNDPSNKYARTS
ncbi:hypothetical protein AAW12_15960 [Sphingobacterium sp. Ag1]|uniref:DUF6712 family protein n=1 Tax=Sphingobacterium sp. Ag1 TaxID=1643451 RepID=UPI0006277B89|nr:DUF6712 family protein [Sphingobacterium sp. Ag1]KKO90572.1 hypothetical protein AAW12_15960 [Sphingobacterium sp. Ag1]